MVTPGVLLCSPPSLLPTGLSRMMWLLEVPNCPAIPVVLLYWWRELATALELHVKCITEIRTTTTRHNRVAKLVHWSLYKKYCLAVSEKSWEHKVEKVVENENVKILWDFRIQTDHHLEHNMPVITVVKGQSVQFIDITVPGDTSRRKRTEKNHEILRPGRQNDRVMDETCNSDTHCHWGAWYHVQEFYKAHQEIAASCNNTSRTAKNSATRNTVYLR